MASSPGYWCSIGMARVVGLEPHAERAALARKRGLEVIARPFAYENVSDLGLFDVVLFADVVEHLQNPFAALEAARKVLRPAGQVVLSVPNVAHWSVRLELLRGRFDYQPFGIMDATHLRWFTHRSLTNLLVDAGFIVEEMAVSAGKWMPDYLYGRPWRWVGAARRDRLVARLAKLRPTLFGCQIVCKARMRPTV